MKYRGYNIQIADAIDLRRYNGINQQIDLCPGVYCEVYQVSDDGLVDRIGDFTLAEGYEIEDPGIATVEQAIRNHVDEHIIELDCIRNEVIAERRNDLIGRLVSWIGEDQAGEELYDTLSDYFGMTDDEIRECGFKSLVPYFDSASYAQTIAEHMIFVGTDNTTSGSWNFGFEEIADRFAVNLSEDKEMLDMILKELRNNSDAVAEVNVYGNDIDLSFCLNSCPFVDKEELEDLGFDQSL